MKSAKILIVEDQKDIGELIKIQLQLKGHQPTLVENGNKAIELIQSPDQQFDLFILDRMLPGISGVEICKFIRFFIRTKTIPILFVTALAQPENIIEGLEAGADDYVTKPFDMNIFMARVSALLRRFEIQILNSQRQGNNTQFYIIGPFKLDRNLCKAWINEEEASLTLSEFKLLNSLIENNGRVLTRQELVDTIQDEPIHVTERTIDTHVFGLRKKLKEASKYIETIRGIGYRVHIDESN